jgi:ribosome maturation factor RimP
MDNLRQWIEAVLEEHGCTLYELNWLTNQKPAILQVAIDRKNGPVDLDICSECSEALSAMLDEKDCIGQEYMLEVCSPGAERELKTDAQIAQAVGRYVYAKLKDPKDGLHEVRGDLLEVQPETVTIAYKDKGRPKKAVIDRDNLALLMTAVKI